MPVALAAKVHRESDVCRGATQGQVSPAQRLAQRLAHRLRARANGFSDIPTLTSVILSKPLGCPLAKRGPPAEVRRARNERHGEQEVHEKINTQLRAHSSTRPRRTAGIARVTKNWLNASSLMPPLSNVLGGIDSGPIANVDLRSGASVCAHAVRGRTERFFEHNSSLFPPPGEAPSARHASAALHFHAQLPSTRRAAEEWGRVRRLVHAFFPMRP